MKNINFNQMGNMTGGICQSFPDNAEPDRCFPKPCWAGTAFGFSFLIFNKDEKKRKKVALPGH